MISKFMFSFVIFCLLVTGVLSVALLTIVKQIQLPAKMVSPLPDEGKNRVVIPIASNQWYSTVYSAFPTQPIYAMPAAFILSPAGVSVSLPHVNKTANTIFAPFVNDFTVGFSEQFSKPKISGHGDWSASLTMRTAHNGFSFTLAHGIPFTVLHVLGSSVVFTFSSNPEIFNLGQEKITKDGLYQMHDFMMQVNGNYYIVVLDSNRNVHMEGTKVIIDTPTRIFIGVLDNKNNYNLFVQNADSEVITTKASFAFHQSTLLTTYAIKSTAQPLVAVYPHQYDFLTNKPDVLGSYDTVRGKLTLIQTSSFTTAIPLITPPREFSPLKNPTSEFLTSLQQDIQTYVKQPPPISKDYYFGTWLGKGISLLQLAEMTQSPAQVQLLQSFLQTKLDTALNNFTYDKNKTSVIATFPEFGNEKLNDHHFHYGYYIRAAAILSQRDPLFLARVKDRVALLVGDIATTKRNSPVFPYLRNFDTYESHSWADGFADFSDGNDQESSSEAINAWYSIYLWGEITNNQQLQDTGLYLYNSEIQGAKYYWFGKNGDYTPAYNHAIASIVWGGKVDFATWFSPETNMKYGIQLIPFTPASNYLGTLGDFATYETDFTQSGGNITKAWGDVFLLWKSFYNPTLTLAEKNQVLSPEQDVPKSLFLYFLLLNAQTKKN